MKVGHRYLIKSWSGALFEIICLEETVSAYKVHNVIQRHDDWIKKSDFEVFGGYKIYEDLGPIKQTP